MREIYISFINHRLDEMDESFHSSFNDLKTDQLEYSVIRV